MKKSNSIYIRIVSVEGMRVTVSSTNPGDFKEIGDPPLEIGGIAIARVGKDGHTRGVAKVSGEDRMVFIGMQGQNLQKLELNKRYKLTSF
jgi:hypothetical protein